MRVVELTVDGHGFCRKSRDSIRLHLRIFTRRVLLNNMPIDWSYLVRYGTVRYLQNATCAKVPHFLAVPSSIRTGDNCTYVLVWVTFVKIVLRGTKLYTPLPNEKSGPMCRVDKKGKKRTRASLSLFFFKSPYFVPTYDLLASRSRKQCVYRRRAFVLSCLGVLA